MALSISAILISFLWGNFSVKTTIFELKVRQILAWVRYLPFWIMCLVTLTSFSFLHKFNRNKSYYDIFQKATHFKINFTIHFLFIQNLGCKIIKVWEKSLKNKPVKLSAFKREPRATMLCAMQVLCKCYASACKCYPSAMQVQCKCYAWEVLCKCLASAMKVLCMRYASPM